MRSEKEKFSMVWPQVTMPRVEGKRAVKVGGIYTCEGKIKS
jgi:hypothetical protein